MTNTPNPADHTDLIAQAYMAGATDVHEVWIAGNGQTEADFGEAASDYASAVLQAHASPRELETFASIIQWGDETFGPAETARIIQRAREEWIEMTSPDADVPIEAADVIIVLLRIPGIAEAIQRKMAINRARQWKLMGDGTGYHVPTRTALELG